MAILVVTGLAGVGKDKVCKRIMEQHPAWRMFPFGTTMVKLGLARNVFKDKTDEEARKNGRPPLNDQVRTLPYPQRMMLQEEVFEAVAKEGSKYNIILNTHAIIPNQELGLQPGLPDDHMIKLKGIPLQLIYVTMSDEDKGSIVVNSSNDPTRQRDARPLGEINRQEMLSLSHLARVQGLLNVNLKIVFNPRVKEEHLMGAEAARAIAPCIKYLEERQAGLAKLEK